LVYCVVAALAITIQGGADPSDFPETACDCLRLRWNGDRPAKPREHHSRMDKPLIDEEITSAVIGSFFEVYNTLGFGFLESVYVGALELELRDRGRRVGREVQVRIRYKDRDVGLHRLDLLVDDRVVVEAKSSAELPKIATRQVYNYLRASRLDVGLLLHFGHEAKFYRCLNPHAPRPAVSGKPG
jgi:GxxExxY protein